MIEEDMFGLEGEKKILRSGIREIYTPHQPVQSFNLFFGRSKEVQSMIRHLNTPGQHALLFGNRGVGKSSLANATADILMKEIKSGQIIKKRCDSSDSFITIAGKILSHVGIDIYELNKSKEQGIGAGNGMFSLSNKNKTESVGYNVRAGSPSWLGV